MFTCFNYNSPKKLNDPNIDNSGESEVTESVRYSISRDSWKENNDRKKVKIMENGGKKLKWRNQLYIYSQHSGRYYHEDLKKIVER